MYKVIVSDEILDQWAKEYFNGYTVAGIPLYNVYTFEQYVEMKKTTLEEVA